MTEHEAYMRGEDEVDLREGFWAGTIDIRVRITDNDTGIDYTALMRLPKDIIKDAQFDILTEQTLEAARRAVKIYKENNP